MTGLDAASVAKLDQANTAMDEAIGKLTRDAADFVKEYGADMAGASMSAALRATRMFDYDELAALLAWFAVKEALRGGESS